MLFYYPLEAFFGDWETEIGTFTPEIGGVQMSKCPDGYDLRNSAGLREAEKRLFIPDLSGPALMTGTNEQVNTFHSNSIFYPDIK
jgi:hypothetical protein